MRFLFAVALPIHLIYVASRWLDFSFRRPALVNFIPAVSGNLAFIKIIQVDTYRVNCYIERVAM